MGAPGSLMANTWPFATGEVGLKRKAARENGLVSGVKLLFGGTVWGPKGPRWPIFSATTPWDLSWNIYKVFYDNRVDFFGYRTSNSLLYLEFTRIDPKVAYLGHFSKFSQQNFSKHTWGPTYRAREGPCTSGNVESFLFWYRSWALVWFRNTVLNHKSDLLRQVFLVAYTRFY